MDHRAISQGRIRDARINLLLHVIEAHLGEDLSVTALASRIHLSPSRLAHVFRDEVGISVERYVRNQRMSVAAARLRSSSSSIKEIASALGFVNPRYFARLFRRYFGCGPSAMRHQQK
ncbi:MAG: helix-turn-helix domain-containing protein [Bryobacterales bacterium]|nr:helix-turn-helix domain-containing protein [Bryobacterales bacterium]